MEPKLFQIHILFKIHVYNFFFTVSSKVLNTQTCCKFIDLLLRPWVVRGWLLLPLLSAQVMRLSLFRLLRVSPFKRRACVCSLSSTCTCLRGVYHPALLRSSTPSTAYLGSSDLSLFLLFTYI